MQHLQFAVNSDFELFVRQTNFGVSVMFRHVPSLKKWNYKDIEFAFFSYEECNTQQWSENGLVKTITAMDAALDFMKMMTSICVKTLPIYAFKAAAKREEVAQPRVETPADRRVQERINEGGVDIAFDVETKKARGEKPIAVTTNLLRPEQRTDKGYEYPSSTKNAVTISLSPTPLPKTIELEVKKTPR